VTAKCKDKFMIQSVTISPEKRPYPLRNREHINFFRLLPSVNLLPTSGFSLLGWRNVFVCVIT
jgi:hypothetical protein